MSYVQSFKELLANPGGVVNMFVAAGDQQPGVQVTSGGISFGAGGNNSLLLKWAYDGSNNLGFYASNVEKSYLDSSGFLNWTDAHNWRIGPTSGSDALGFYEGASNVALIADGGEIITTSGISLGEAVFGVANINTAGVVGVSTVYAAILQKGETGADSTLLSYTPPSTAGAYKLHIVMSVSAASVATLGWTATWKDSNGHAQTPTNLALDTIGAVTISLTVSAAANAVYSSIVPIDIDNSATAIVIKTTFSGTSIAYKASAWIEQSQ